MGVQSTDDTLLSLVRRGEQRGVVETAAGNLRRAGFCKVRLGRVRLAWQQFGVGDDLKDRPPWDWFFRAEPQERSRS